MGHVCGKFNLSPSQSHALHRPERTGTTTKETGVQARQAEPRRLQSSAPVPCRAGPLHTPARPPRSAVRRRDAFSLQGHGVPAPGALELPRGQKGRKKHRGAVGVFFQHQIHELFLKLTDTFLHPAHLPSGNTGSQGPPAALGPFQLPTRQA